MKLNNIGIWTKYNIGTIEYYIIKLINKSRKCMCILYVVQKPILFEIRLS